MDPVLPELPTYLFEPTLAGVLSLVLTFVLPLIAALFMRANWSAWSKGLVLLGVAAVKTFLEAWAAAVAENLAFNFVTAAYAVLINFGLAVVFYVGLLKDTKIQRTAINGGVVRTIGGTVR